MTQKKKITVINVQQYDMRFPPQPLNEFTKWLSEMVSEVPYKDRDSILVEISSSSPDYDDEHYGNVEISYTVSDDDLE